MVSDTSQDDTYADDSAVGHEEETIVPEPDDDDEPTEPNEPVEVPV